MEKKSRRKSVGVTLSDVIHIKLRQLESEGRIGALTNYTTLKHYVESHYGLVNVKSLDTEFTDRMAKDMKLEGLSLSTQRTYLSMLRAIFNLAAYKGWVSHDKFPFRRVACEYDKTKIPTVASGATSRYLSKSDMVSLWEAYKGMKKGKRRLRTSLFFVSYLCGGANMTDILRFRWCARSKGEVPVIEFVRGKTSERCQSRVVIPITKWLDEILSEHASEIVVGEPVFKDLGGYDCDPMRLYRLSALMVNRCSEGVRSLARPLGIREDVSFAFARKAFCSVLNFEGVPHSLIERSMGHSLGISDHYLGDWPPEKLMEAFSHLL